MANRCTRWPGPLAGTLAAVSVACTALLLMAPRLAAAADETGAASNAGIVAQAGSLTLDAPEIRALVASLPAEARTAVRSNLTSLEQIVQGALVRQAVLKDALAGGFDRTPDVLAQLQQVHDEALVNLWIAKQAAVPAGYPSDAEIAAAYAANQQALAAPTQYRFGQIFISAPDGGDPAKLAAALRKAADIAAKIATSDFSQLAQQQSEDPQSASHGGDLGYLPQNRIQPEILTAVRDLKPGQVVGPIKTAQGLRFLKLLDKKPGVIPTLAQAHDALVAALRRQRATQLEQTYLASYRAKLGVTVNQIELAKLQQTLPR